MTDHERFTQPGPETGTSHPIKDNKVQTDQGPDQASEQHESNDRSNPGTHGRPTDDSDPGHS